MRKRWIVAYLENGGDNLSSYLDVAVSRTDTPTQQYNVYQFAPHFRPNVPDDFCYRMTLGVDYWGTYSPARTRTAAHTTGVPLATRCWR